MRKGGGGTMSLADKVKQRREQLGMNQKQLAEASDITQGTISRIESGQVKELKSEALKRLAAALRVTVDFLVDRTDSLTPNEIVESDPNADYIFRGYEKLSARGREQVKNFVRFLEQQEAEEERGRQ
jgi:transcriptional regulator with XRE-family HTH domain